MIMVRFQVVLVNFALHVAFQQACVFNNHVILYAKQHVLMIIVLKC